MSDKIDVEGAEEKGRQAAEEAKLRAETVAPKRLHEAIDGLVDEVETLKDELPEVYREELTYRVLTTDSAHPYIQVRFYKNVLYLSIVQAELGRLTPAYTTSMRTELISTPEGYCSGDWHPVDALSAVRRAVENGIAEIALKGGIDVIREQRKAQKAADEKRYALKKEEVAMYEKARKLPLGIILFTSIVLLFVVFVVATSLS